MKSNQIIHKILSERYRLDSEGWNPTNLYLGELELKELSEELFRDNVYSLQYSTEKDLLNKMKTGKFKIFDLLIIPVNLDHYFYIGEKYD